MGDEILIMKKILLISLLSIYSFSSMVGIEKTVEDNASVNLNSSLVKEYQEMFEKIGEQRVGLEHKEIEKVAEPFLKVVKKKKIDDSEEVAKKVKKLPPLILEAILGRSVRINGAWYRLHEKIRGAKIVAIGDNSVRIKSISFNKKLTLRKSNANISIK